MSKGRRGAAPAPVAAATSAMALYEQVKDFIARKIQEGVWRAGDRLPSESELVTQFGISRMTVNRALRELAAQGRIVRVAGVGSFVAEVKPNANRPDDRVDVGYFMHYEGTARAIYIQQTFSK